MGKTAKLKKPIKKSRTSCFVYMVECADKTFYIGYTNNVSKRIVAHNSLKTGAKYTKSRRPVRLVYSEKCKNLSLALKREYVLKQMSRAEKLQLARSDKQNEKETNHNS